MAEVKDDYLEQLKVEADWAGTYLSGSGVESGPYCYQCGRKLVKQLIQNGILWWKCESCGNYSDYNGPALTSGDGSESAGLREQVRNAIESALKHVGFSNWDERSQKWLDTSTHDSLVNACTNSVMSLTALAPAISRPPTQGSADTPQSGLVHGDRPDYVWVKLKVYGLHRLEDGQINDADIFTVGYGHNARFGITRMHTRTDAIAEGQQSSELVEKTPSASPGERE